MTNPTYRPEMLKLLSERLQKCYIVASKRQQYARWVPVDEVWDRYQADALEELALTHYLLRVAEAQIKLTVTYAEIEGTWDTSDEDAARKVNAELGIS
jgi:hypothetical protein